MWWILITYVVVVTTIGTATLILVCYNLLSTPPLLLLPTPSGPDDNG